MGISWCAYLNMLSLAPSCHCGRWTLILCSDTLDPWMHRFMAHTKVMAILLLLYSNVLEQGCRQFFARRTAILFVGICLLHTQQPINRGKKGEKVDVAVGIPPSTYSTLLVLHPEDTFPVSSQNGTYCQCSQNACQQHCHSHSYRGNGLVGCPSVQ